MPPLRAQGGTGLVVQHAAGEARGHREPSTDSAIAAVSDKQPADEPDPKGVVVGQVVGADNASDDPAAQLYKDARAALRSEEYEQAIELFRGVEDGYPYLDLAKEAKLGVAYALFLEGEYHEVIEELNQFTVYYPAYKNIDYVYYLKAVSYYRQIPGPGHDVGSWKLASDALEVFLRRFPDSTYANDASIKARDVADILAANHMSIGRYYQDRDELLAAIKRFQLVVWNYSETSQTPEALHRLAECFAALGVIDEAQQTAQVQRLERRNADSNRRCGSILGWAK
jgi:outer membrane protein assembly factor BamD